MAAVLTHLDQLLAGFLERVKEFQKCSDFILIDYGKRRGTGNAPGKSAAGLFESVTMMEDLSSFGYRHSINPPWEGQLNALISL